MNLPQSWVPERAGGNSWSAQGRGEEFGVTRTSWCGLGRLEIQAIWPQSPAQLGHELTTPNPRDKNQKPKPSRAEPLPLHHPCPHQTGTHLTGNTMSWGEEAPGRSLPASPSSKQAVHPPAPTRAAPAPSDPGGYPRNCHSHPAAHRVGSEKGPPPISLVWAAGVAGEHPVVKKQLKK